MNVLKQGFNVVKGAVSNAVDSVKKVGEVILQTSTKAYIAVGASVGALFSGTPAHADLATTLKTVETAATTGIDTVTVSVATVYVSVFGLVILGAGIAWLFSAVKKR